MDQKDVPNVSLHLPRCQARYVQGTFRLPFVKILPERDFWSSVWTKILHCIAVIVYIWALWYFQHKLHTKKWYYCIGKRREKREWEYQCLYIPAPASRSVFANNLHCSRFILGEMKQRSDFSSTCKLNEKRLCCWLWSAIVKSPHQPIRCSLISITIQ